MFVFPRWLVFDFRRSSRGTKRNPSKLSTPVTADAGDDNSENSDSETSVYQPNLHLDDVDMLLDPTTAPAAYRNAISGL